MILAGKKRYGVHVASSKLTSYIAKLVVTDRFDQETDVQNSPVAHPRIGVAVTVHETIEPIGLTGVGVLSSAELEVHGVNLLQSRI